MRTSKSLLFVVVLLFILVIGNIIFSFRQMGQNQDPNDRNDTNITDTVIEKVKNAKERARMQTYLNEYQKGQKIIKSIVGPSGEIIDFVDLYSQPSLRKHKITRDQIQFFPSSFPKEVGRDSIPKQVEYKTSNMLFELTGDTCPVGAIPIRRLTMKTLTSFETLEDFFHKSHGYINPPCGGDGGSAAGHEYAHAARSISNWGAESVLNLWDNYVEKSDEFSLSQMWVTRGSGANLETLEAGWQVYKDLYGDWRPHLFIYFTPDNYGDGGGYNLSTGDFVQVNNSVYIGGGFTNYSSLNGTQYTIKLMILKDHENGDWWLKYGDTWVGYWPRSLFDANGLHNQSSNIDFGGEIVNTQTDSRHTKTDMGSGYWPYQGYGYAAFHRNVRYIDLSYFYNNATGLSATRTNSNCYDINLVESGGSWGVYFYFGGSGYNSGCK